MASKARIRATFSASLSAPPSVMAPMVVSVPHQRVVEVSDQSLEGFVALPAAAFELLLRFWPWRSAGSGSVAAAAQRAR
ncbi:MAG: hypothetical protein ACLQOO_32900 [Terriglobia bacterium]